jgi:hypothetical protein
VLRRVVILLVVGGIVWWIIRDKPTVTGLIDRITSPLLGSKAAVKESEHNRVVGEAVPAITDDDEKKVGALREGMRAADVRDLLGEPDSVENVVQEGKRRQVWSYRRVHRLLYFEDGRIAEIQIK